MNDWAGLIQREYGLEIKGIHKQRGAVGFDCDQKTYLLQPFQGSKKRLLAERELLEQLALAGFTETDRLLPTQTGALYSINEYQERYVLRNWFPGEECSSFDLGFLRRGVAKLAHLHKKLRQISEPVFPELLPETIVEAEEIDIAKQFRVKEIPMERLRFSWADFTEESRVSEMEKHNRELRKIRGFIQERKKKTQFEACVLSSFTETYEQATRALFHLTNSTYAKEYQEAVTKKYLRHGDYNYHNLIYDGELCYVVHFAKFGIQVQLLDLYDYLRKIMEKYNWDVDAGKQLIEEYDRIISLSSEDLQILASLFLYPEKYWKQLNYFYNGNKTWISAKSIEKLIRAVNQCRDREDFIERALDVQLT